MPTNSVLNPISFLFSSFLNQILTVSTKDNCRDLYGVNGITDGMICVIDKDTKKSPCSGDSGGPLIVPKSSSDDTSVVIGIASWVTSCDGEKPAVFADVINYLNWIKPKMEN